MSNALIKCSCWISAYTGGARLEEVTGAYKQDTIQKNGMCGFSFSPDARQWELKNVGSIRFIPLHPAVIANGFLDYVKSLPDGPLFPQKKPDKHGRRSSGLSDDIGKFLRDIGVKKDGRLSHASFRHFYKTLCRGCHIDREIHDALTGHADGTASNGYGVVSVAALKAAIQKLPDVLNDPDPATITDGS